MTIEIKEDIKVLFEKLEKIKDYLWPPRKRTPTQGNWKPNRPNTILGWPWIRKVRIKRTDLDFRYHRWIQRTLQRSGRQWNPLWTRYRRIWWWHAEWSLPSNSETWKTNKTFFNWYNTWWRRRSEQRHHIHQCRSRRNRSPGLGWDALSNVFAVDWPKRI